LTTAIKSTLSSSAALLALVCAACGGAGNTGNTVPGSDPVPANPGTADTSTVPIIDKIPWVNGAVPNLDPTTGLPVTAPLPYYPPLSTAIIANFDATKPMVATNGDDSNFSSAPIDCSVTAPYELAPWVATSEPQQLVDEQLATDPTFTDPGFPGIAARWAGADDLTRGSWRVPGFTTWYPALAPLPPTIWGTPAEAVPMGAVVPTCDGQPNNWVIHMRGAGFRYYGGNIAHILAGDNYPMPDPNATHCPPGSDLCPADPDPTTTLNPIGFPRVPTEHQTATPGWELKALHTYWDVSKYDGVSFWARRGPDSMGTLLVTLAEKHTSDDMNRQNETFCRRIFACHSTCQNYQPCSLSPTETTNSGGPLFRCYDPAKGPIPALPNASGNVASDDELDAIYPRCGQSACTFRSTYPDADFEGKECKPYTFTSGESNEYCYNADGHDALGNVVPVDPPPPSRFDRCVDGYTSMVQLSTEWTLYTLPFSDMRQGGYGKVSPYFDLTSLYSLTLGWGVGNVDFFLDDISFYRVKAL
jgi:hypothetical protein